MMRRRDERTGRQALIDDTKRAIIMDMCPVKLEKAHGAQLRRVRHVSESLVGQEGFG